MMGLSSLASTRLWKGHPSMKRALSFLAPLLLVPVIALADDAPRPATTTPAPATATDSTRTNTTTVTTTEKPAELKLVMPEVGKDAPEFKLPSQDGSEIKLEDYKGKWVVLYFYPKDFTGGCTLEAQNFQKDLAKYKAKDTVILGVSLDSVSSHKDFCAKESLQFKLLSDTDHKVAEKYGSLMEYKGTMYASRSTFVIDPKGVVRKVYPKVDPAKHSAEVLADLDALKKAPKG
jgi:peroxiredoxin Q/BCP